MTRKDLTRGFVKIVADQIQKAYRYFGEVDEERLKRIAKKKITNMWEEIDICKPEVMQTDDGVVEGYLINVGLGGEERPNEMRNGCEWTCENIQVLYLVVNENSLQYVIKSYDCYHRLGNKSLDDDEYTNYSYKKVKLEEVDRSVIGRSLI